MRKEIEILIKAALAGGAEARRLLPSASKAVMKDRGDFATEADLGSEKKIMEILSSELPTIPVVAEESFNGKSVPSSCITVDPLDGTIIASRGCPEYSVLLSRIENGTVLDSVLYQPQFRLLLAASKDAGCFLRRYSEQRVENEIRIEQIEGDPAERLVVAIDFNFSSTAEDATRVVLPLLANNKLAVARTMGAAGASVFELLAGRIDAYLNFSGGKIWDFAPGALAVTEAGGSALLIERKTMLLKPFNVNTLEFGIVLARTPEIAEAVRLAMTIH